MRTVTQAEPRQSDFPEFVVLQASTYYESPHYLCECFDRFPASPAGGAALAAPVAVCLPAGCLSVETSSGPHPVFQEASSERSPSELAAVPSVPVEVGCTSPAGLPLLPAARVTVLRVAAVVRPATSGLRYPGHSVWGATDEADYAMCASRNRSVSYARNNSDFTAASPREPFSARQWVSGPVPAGRYHHATRSPAAPGFSLSYRRESSSTPDAPQSGIATS